MKQDKLYRVETRSYTYIYAEDKEEAEDLVNEMLEKLDGYKVVSTDSEVQDIEELEDYQDEEE